MFIWAIFGFMTAAALLCVLWPLSRRPTAAPSLDLETRFYRDQIAEIERDLERELISPAEAEAAKAEAARRLLRSGKDPQPSREAVGEPALRRRRAASALALSTVPIFALAIYGAYGSPHLPGAPLAARAPAQGNTDLATAIARIETHLAKNPGDGRGWEVVAPVYLRSGRPDDAAKAYQSALRLLGKSAPRLAAYAEALVTAKDGLIVAEARSALDEALALDPANLKARFYLAQAAEQDGDAERARGHYAELVGAAAPDAPWLPWAKERLARLGGGAAPSLAALPADDREAAIRGMVEGLAARLENRGGTAGEWSQLVRSYAVLGEVERARSALQKARQSLGPTDKPERLEAVARDLGLEAARER